MPNGRLERTRVTLPEGYQFGDASLNARMGSPFGLTVTRESRAILSLWDSNRRHDRAAVTLSPSFVEHLREKDAH